MFQRRTKPNLSRVKNGDISKGEKITQRKAINPEPVDHWAFLDEIEAPMWIDLTLEGRSSYEDRDDNWFQISHPFHRWSSRHLISAFSHVGDSSRNLDFAIEGSSSPDIPSQVSTSRGKHYRSREWGLNNCQIEIKKGHPVKNLTRKSSGMNLGPGEKIKSETCNKDRKGNDRTKEDRICKSCLTETSACNYPKSSMGGSSSAAVEEVENKSASTVTSERTKHQPQKSLEVSSWTSSHTSGLLSALKVTLRKSYITRKASRVEAVDRSQLEGQKSSSGKSSVGSSSHPACDIKSLRFLALQNRDMTPESRTFARVLQATQDNVKVTDVSKHTTAQAQELTSKCRKGGDTTGTMKPTQSKTAKEKVIQGPSKVTRQRRKVNDQGSVTTGIKKDDKLGLSKYNRLGDGKENAMSQRFNNKAGQIVPVQKVTKQIASEKMERMGFIVPMGKVGGKSKGKSLSNSSHKVLQIR
ncbi:hypothetical protein NMG60_11002306 [Bertholletia excelsa]